MIARNAFALSTLKLNTCDNNIREYIHQANTLLRGITQANRTYPHGQLISNILNRLPGRFSTFVDLTLYTKQLDSYDATSYTQFTKNLIQYADEHKAKCTQNKGSNNTNNNNSKGKGGSNNGNNKDKRTCHFYSFRSHVEKDCRKKKTAIIEQGTDNPTKPEPPTYDKDGKPSKGVKSEKKPEVANLTMSLKNDNDDDDSDDNFPHLAALGLCDDYVLHSDPPSTSSSSTFPLTADPLQSKISRQLSSEGIENGTRTTENETN